MPTPTHWACACFDGAIAERPGCGCRDSFGGRACGRESGLGGNARNLVAGNCWAVSIRRGAGTAEGHARHRRRNVSSWPGLPTDRRRGPVGKKKQKSENTARGQRWNRMNGTRAWTEHLDRQQAVVRGWRISIQRWLSYLERLADQSSCAQLNRYRSPLVRRHEKKLNPHTSR